MTLLLTGSPLPSPITLDWDTPCPKAIWSNLAFRSHATNVHIPEHYGVLSIKCAFRGQEVYEVQGRPMAVDESSYLILNEGQRYASYIESDTLVESVCIFFHPHFARSLLRSLVTSPERLLDDPVNIGESAPFFFERLYPHDQSVSPVLFRIREALRSESPSREWLEEHFHILLERLLAARSHVFAEAERLSAVKLATRLELYQRLYWAKDFMDANLGQPLCLPQIADVACLSPHYFLRLFHQLFSMTPYQYLILRRLELAQRLLRKTDLPVTAICLEVGFASPSTLSNLFRRKYGVTPSQYRRIHHEPLFAVGCDLHQNSNNRIAESPGNRYNGEKGSRE